MSDEPKGPSVQLVYRKTDAGRVVTWPCTIDVPKDDGKIEKQKLTARFKLLARERTKELTNPFSTEVGDPNKAVLDEALVGFVGLQDESKQAVSDEDAKTLFLSIDYVVVGLARGYFEMAQGRLPKN